MSRALRSVSRTPRPAASRTSPPAASRTQRPAAPTTQRPAVPTTQRPAVPTTQRPAAPTTQRPAASPRSNRPGSEYNDLLRRIGTGDREAYGQLYRATRSLVFSRVHVIVRDIGYAEETCHEVYLQVWRSAAAFDPTRGNALTWLCALAHHQAVDRVRRERIAYGYENRWGAADYRRPADVVSEEIVRRNEEHAVRTGLTTLTPRQRESVVLAFYGGLTYRQVAARLGIGEPAAKERIRSGLAHLKSALTAAPA